MAELASLLLAIAGGVDVAARTSSDITRLIRAWRDAPSEMIALEQEIRSSYQAGEQLKRLSEGLDAESDIFYVATISSQICRAKPYWVELERILRSLTDSKGHLRKSKWVKSSRKVVSLRQRLRELRFVMLEILNVYTASQSLRIKYIITKQHQAQDKWMEATTNSLSHILSRLDSERKLMNQRQINKSKEVTFGPDARLPEPAWATIRHLNEPGERCGLRCVCRCHFGKRQGWFNLAPFKGMLGSLSIIYFRWELAGPRCNIPSCQRARYKSFQVSCYTSRSQHAYTVVVSITSRHGEPTIDLSIGRVVYITSEHDCRSMHSVVKSGSTSEALGRLETRPNAVLDVDYSTGYSALHVAAFLGRLSMVQVLLTAGADPFLEDRWGVLDVFECLRRLLQCIDDDSDINSIMACLPLESFLEEYNLSHLHRIVLGFRPLRLQEEMNKMACRDVLNAQDDTGMTPLHWASVRGDVSMVSILLNAGGQVDIPNKRGRTACYEACQSNAKQCVHELLIFGADVNARSDIGYTPIHAASVGNATLGLLSQLLSAGADIHDSENETKSSPLSKAAASNNALCARNLLDMGAEIDVEDNDGDTPLHEAVCNNASACIRLLLSRGANFLHENKSGQTILHQAAKRGDGSVFEVLAAVDLKEIETDVEDDKMLTARQIFATRSGVTPEIQERFESLLYSIKRRNGHFDGHVEANDSDENAYFDALEHM